MIMEHAYFYSLNLLRGGHAELTNVGCANLCARGINTSLNKHFKSIKRISDGTRVP